MMDGRIEFDYTKWRKIFGYEVRHHPFVMFYVLYFPHENICGPLWGNPLINTVHYVPPGISTTMGKSKSMELKSFFCMRLR